MARTILTVFLSSTGKDLEAFRAEVRKRISAIEFLKCIAMEDFGPQDATAVDLCRKKVGEADLFVGLIGLRRGWEPPGDNTRRSITEMEYDWAVGANRGRFMCVAPNSFSVSGSLIDADAVRERQKKFRARILSERVSGVHNWESPVALAAEVVTALISHIVSTDLVKVLRPELASVAAPEVHAPIAAAVEKLAEDKDVDLLALARNPKGVELEELERRLRTRAEEHEKKGIEELGKSAEYFRHIGALAFLHNTQKALQAYRKAIDLDTEDAESWNQLGLLLYRVGELDQAFAAYERVLAIGTVVADQGIIAATTRRLGNIYFTRGDIFNAEKMYRKALALNEVLGRKAGIAADSGNLGIIYQKRGDLDRAEEMYRNALAIDEVIGHKEGIARHYCNLGTVYRERDDLDGAEEMYLKALAIDEELGQKEGMATNYGNLGGIHYERDNLEEAEEMYLRSLALNEGLSRKEGVAVNYGSLGNLYSKRGDFGKAEEMYAKGLALNAELGRKEGMAIQYSNLALIEELRENKKAACANWRRARNLYVAIGLSEEAVQIEALMREAGCGRVGVSAKLRSGKSSGSSNRSKRKRRK